VSAAMTTSVLALVVAVLLGAYLVHTLVRPEKY
jgi:K+-transporting ATPase KdpF subunit